MGLDPFGFTGSTDSGKVEFTDTGAPPLTQDLTHAWTLRESTNML